MTSYLVDTSCLVAAVSSWHPRHVAVVSEILGRSKRREKLTVAAHGLVESYAVLTRLPTPHRLAPEDAWAVIHESFGSRATLIALDAEEHTALLSRLAKHGVSGGRAYDAVIAECARKGSVRALVTLNPRHFEPFATTFDVVVPGGA